MVGLWHGSASKDVATWAGQTIGSRSGRIPSFIHCSAVLRPL